MSDDEVIERWTRIFKSPVLIQRYTSKVRQTHAELRAVGAIVQEWRWRLSNLGWLMKCINENLAINTNFEDKCTGRFWDRFFAPAKPAYITSM